MSATIEDFEDIAVKCSICSGDAIDLVPIGELKICLECVNPKKECA